MIKNPVLLNPCVQWIPICACGCVSEHVDVCVSMCVCE